MTVKIRRLAKVLFALLVSLLLFCPGCVHPSPQSRVPESYELTVQAWPGFDRRKGFEVRRILKPDIPFCIEGKDPNGNSYRATGTIRAKSPDHFYIEDIRFQAYGGTMTASLICDSEETMRLRRTYHDGGEDETPQGDFNCQRYPGSGYWLNLKRVQ
jgi:hypothetical protein